MDFLVNRQDLRQCRSRRTPRPSPRTSHRDRCCSGIESFAFTANNVTYGAVGDVIGYWSSSRPTGLGNAAGLGVRRRRGSGEAGFAAGERIYGYFPMSEHLVVRPRASAPSAPSSTRAASRGCRSSTTSTSASTSDPGYGPRGDRHAPPAALHDGVPARRPPRRDGFFGARAVLVSSASSKTAFSLAYLLARDRRQDCEVIGLTSPRNLDFVRGLGCYDQVVPYDDVGSLAADRAIVLVDMAGNQQVTGDVHRHFGAGVKYSCQVGLTHWEKGGSADGLPGAKPEFFFAPEPNREAHPGLGRERLQSRLTSSWRTFLDGTEAGSASPTDGAPRPWSSPIATPSRATSSRKRGSSSPFWGLRGGSRSMTRRPAPRPERALTGPPSHESSSRAVLESSELSKLCRSDRLESEHGDRPQGGRRWRQR